MACSSRVLRAERAAVSGGFAAAASLPRTAEELGKKMARVTEAHENEGTLFFVRRLLSIFGLSPIYLHQVMHHQVSGVYLPWYTTEVDYCCSTLVRTTYGPTSRTGRSGLLRNKSPPLHLQRHHSIILGVHSKETPTEN